MKRWFDSLLPEADFVPLQKDQSFIQSGIDGLDSFFCGGLPRGKITEIGIPEAQNCRAFVLPFLRKHAKPALWVLPPGGLLPYPPSWESKGICLRQLAWIYSTRPVSDLKPLFCESSFSIFILDCPKTILPSDLHFLANKIRKTRQAVFLLRPYRLTSRLGSPLAAVRFNLSWRSYGQQVLVRAVKKKAPTGEQHSFAVPLSNLEFGFAHG